jgi:NNP family nitrate/nitrite transporter-like MFS transporter
MVILYSLASAGIQGVYLMTPTFLVAEAGYTVAFANALVGVTRTVTILTLATAGFVVAKAPLKTMLVLIMAVSGLSLLLTGILHGLPLIIMMCVQPAFSALFSSIGYRLLSLVGPIQLRSLSFSLVTPIGALIGTGLVPAFLGYMGSNYSFSTGFMVLGILMLLSVPLVPTIRYFHQQPS